MARQQFLSRWFLNVDNWDDMGRRRPRQVVQTFFESMQYVYHFKGNFSGSLGHILLFGCGQLGRQGMLASHTG